MGHLPYSLTCICLAAAVLLITETAVAQQSTVRIPIGKRAHSTSKLGLSSKPISLDVRNADVRSVLRLFAKESGINIVPSSDVQGTVTFSFTDVPLRKAFLSVLRSQGLTWQRQGAILLIRPR